MKRYSGVDVLQHQEAFGSESEYLTRGCQDIIRDQEILENSTSEHTTEEFEIAACPMESAGIQARCSVKAIHETISRFDGRKRKLVESIGFGGLLHFPPIKSTNKRFSAWLISNVDVATSSIILPDGDRITFTSKDIGIVFGIPSVGKKVVEAGHLSREGKQRMKVRCWPLTGKEQRSIKAVQELLDTNYHGSMTSEEEDTFKVAFVIYVMSTLFVPAAKHDYVCADNWGALSEPSCIHLYDWADYIHNRLLASVTKFKTDAMSGCPNPNITGCYLFLQVLYLDNMDLGQWNMDHNVLPRITCFTNERLRSMIAALATVRPGTNHQFEYGKWKVRPRNKSCYTWTSEGKENYICGDECGQISLWEASVNMAKVLRVPIESAGPLFLAVAEYERRAGPGASKCGIQCINVMLNIMRPYVNGYRYNFGLDDEESGTTVLAGKTTLLNGSCTSESDSTRDVINNECIGSSDSYHNTCRGARLMDRVHNGNENEGSVVGNSACQSKRRNNAGGDLNLCNSTKRVKYWDACSSLEGVGCSVISAMSQFYLLVRRMKAHNRLDLNTTCTEEDPWQYVQAAREVKFGGDAKTPWELGGMWDYKEQAACPLARRTMGAGDSSATEIPYVVDYCPKYIEVMPGAAVDQANGLSEMEMDIFDAIIRSFMQSDDIIYRAEGRVRWRHFFESDIMASIIAGWFDKENPCVRNQFIGPHLKYDIYNCNILFFPFILHDRWVCFAWNLKMNNIVVFDPACVNIPGFPRSSVYKRVVNMLKDVLSATIVTLFKGWHHDWDAATVVPFNWRYAGVHCWNRTGVLCAYFCRCFDGEGLLPDIEMGHLGRVASLMFADISRLRANRSRMVGHLSRNGRF